MKNIISHFRIVIIVSLVVYASCTQNIIKKENKTIVLPAHTLVYETNNLNSSILNILPKGKTVNVEQYSNGWNNILSDEGKGLWFFTGSTKGASENRSKKSEYRKFNFKIPDSGNNEPKIVKISDNYTLNLKNSNAKKTFERLGTLEKIKFKIPSNLSPITYDNSMQSFETVMNDLENQGFFQYIQNEQTIIPYLWPSGMNDKFINEALFVNSTLNGYDVKSDRNQLANLSVLPKGFIITTDDEFIKYDNMRKVVKKKSFLEIINNEDADNDYEIFNAFVYSESDVYILIATNDSESSDNAASTIYFLNDELDVINKQTIVNLVINNVDISKDGLKIIIRCGEQENEATPEKSDFTYNRRGDLLYKNVYREKEMVLYDDAFIKQVMFEHNKIIINNLEKKSSVENQTPVEFRKTWLIACGDDYVSVAKDNQLFTFDLNSGSVFSQYRLSIQDYKFIAISQARFALLSSPDSKGTWSVIDLPNNRICITSYKGDVFTSYPTTIVAFPCGNYYVLASTDQTTKNIIFGDIDGNLYKTKLFVNSQKIQNICFKGNSLLELITDAGKYYIPVYQIMNNMEKIN